ncbi:MAG: DUF4147 domain-containing protein [Planctomycetales bacterium]|nr:DUF4147 domain-containing protein [Planctomycetales bacterium]
MSDSPLIRDALAIWKAGVQAVTPAQLFRQKAFLDGNFLCVEGASIDLSEVRRLVVVGAGKASAAMAVALQEQLLCRLPPPLRRLPVVGWINAPQGTYGAADQARLGGIHLHAARPAGLNEPTAEAVSGTQEILQLVSSCDHRDAVLCLLSGGGSALLVAPKPGVTLADKQAVAREISAAGGDIEQLNAVRRALSDIKGGGLARACRAGRLLTLILSDVLGDPLQTIASGPTVGQASASPQQALRVLQQLDLLARPALSRVVHFLQHSPDDSVPALAHGTQVEHLILGNNADAVDAAGVKAVELGYRYVMQVAGGPEGEVRALAKKAAAAVQQLAGQREVDCWISGGEPTVKLPAGGAGKGGRNQQLALAVLQELRQAGWPSHLAAQPAKQRALAFVSGGTDGEDGPTDAAGAWFDVPLAQRAIDMQLDLEDYLARADAYPFFQQLGGLLNTGPTGTNVCDLRVALAARRWA